MKDKVINDLLKRISDLEFEVEKQEQRINKALYILEHIDDDRVGYDAVKEILKGEDKE